MEERVGFNSDIGREVSILVRTCNGPILTTQRKMDVSIHAEIASARVDITQGSSDSTAALSHIRNTASSIENKVDGLSTTVGTFLQDNNAQVSGLRGIVLDTQEATNSARMQVFQKLDSVTGGSKAQHSALQNDVRGGVNSVRKDIHIMSQSMRQSRRQQTRKQRSATKKIMNKLEEVNANMVDNFATLNLTRTGDGAFTFEGSNLEAMTLPLELLYSELVRTLPALQSKTKLNVSQSEAGWIQQQFEMVRAASFEISASTARSRATQRPPSAIARNPWRQQIVMHSASSSGFVGQRSPAPASRRLILYQSESLKTPIGTLNLSVIRSNGTRKDPKDTELESMAITFCPSDHFGLPGVSANFTHHHPFTRQHIPPIIRIWNIVPRDSPAFAAVARDDVSELIRLFEVGVASPFDRTPDGYSLAIGAIEYHSCQSFKLLLEQGAGIQEIESATKTFTAPGVLRSKDDALKLYQMISLISAHILGPSSDDKLCTWIALCPIFSILEQVQLNFWECEPSDAELFSCFKYSLQVHLENFLGVFKKPIESVPVVLLLAYAVVLGNILVPISRFYELLDIHLPSLECLGDIIAGAFSCIQEDLDCRAEIFLPYLVELLQMGVSPDCMNKDGFTLSDYALDDMRTLLVWIAAVRKAGFQLSEVHCADGISLEEHWTEFLEDLREISGWKKAIAACDMDQLGDMTEAFLMQSSRLREAWLHGMEVEDFFLIGVACLWD